MLNRLKVLLGTTALVLQLSGWAAAAPTDLELLKKLYTKLGEQFRLEEDIPRSGKNFLVLLNPGFVVDPTFNPESTSDASASAFYRLFDRVLEPDWLYSPRSTMVTKLYENILDFHETPKFSLSDDQKAKIAAAKAFLYTDADDFVESPVYRKFQELEDLVGDLSVQLDDWRRNNPGMNPPASLIIQHRRAIEKLETIGAAPGVLVHISNWRRYEKFDPEYAWAKAKRNFDLNTRETGGDGGQRYGIYGFYPSYSQWFNTSATWHKLTLKESDLEHVVENRRTSLSAGGHASYGFFKAKANYDESTQWKSDEQTISDSTLSGEYLRVNLDPLFMDASIFGQDSWTWSTTAVGPNTARLSGGQDANSGVLPSGQMPFLPVGLLLAKNVSLSGNWKYDLQTYYQKIVDASAGASYGPFALSGRYHEDKDRSYTKGTVRGAALEFVSPQIIGIFVQVLPKTPDPNAEYDWPDSAKLDFGAEDGTIPDNPGADESGEAIVSALRAVSPVYAKAKAEADSLERGGGWAGASPIH